MDMKGGCSPQNVFFPAHFLVHITRACKLFFFIISTDILCDGWRGLPYLGR